MSLTSPKSETAAVGKFVENNVESQTTIEDTFQILASLQAKNLKLSEDRKKFQRTGTFNPRNYATLSRRLFASDIVLFSVKLLESENLIKSKDEIFAFNQACDGLLA